MKNKIFIILIFSLVFIPVFSRASSGFDIISVSLVGQKEDAVALWSKNIEIVSDGNYDFMATVRNNSAGALDNVTLNLEIPGEIMFRGKASIGGSKDMQDIKKAINLGMFLPWEQKTVMVETQMQALIFKEQKKDIIAKVSFGKSEFSDFLGITIKPYQLNPEAGLASAGNFTKTWYFAILGLLVIIYFFFKFFFRLFSTPMG